MQLATIVGDMAAAGLRSLVLLGALGWTGIAGWAQTNVSWKPASSAVLQTDKAEETERPLPDIPTLMREVEAHQKAAEAIQKDYLYHEVQTAHKTDGQGNVKKADIREFDVFWIEGVPVRRMTKKNGKELTAEEKKKESERIDKEVAKAKERRAKADAEGKKTDLRGHEEIEGAGVLPFHCRQPERVLREAGRMLERVAQTDVIRRRRMPGERVVRRRVVILHAVVHAPHERHLVHHLGHARQRLGNA